MTWSVFPHSTPPAACNDQLPHDNHKPTRDSGKDQECDVGNSESRKPKAERPLEQPARLWSAPQPALTKIQRKQDRKKRQQLG